MHTLSIVGVYLLSIFGGWLICGPALWVMYKSIGQSRAVFAWISFWVGAAERAVATTLVILAPGVLAPFVGGWIVLKIAANWQRRTGEQHSEGHLLALVGSVISFSIAIGAGLCLHPEALQTWAK